MIFIPRIAYTFRNQSESRIVVLREEMLTSQPYHDINQAYDSACVYFGANEEYFDDHRDLYPCCESYTNEEVEGFDCFDVTRPGEVAKYIYRPVERTELITYAEKSDGEFKACAVVIGRGAYEISRAVSRWIEIFKRRHPEMRSFAFAHFEIETIRAD